MEFVIKYMLVMIGIIAIIIIYSMARVGEEKNKKYPIKNENKPLYKIIGFIGATFLTIIILSKIWTSNPIIGKWQSETNVSFIGKSIKEIEFTEDREYSIGITSKVKYEIEKNRIIVTDELGIGVIYEILDNNTMRSNAFGMETIYRRIK